MSVDRRKGGEPTVTVTRRASVRFPAAALPLDLNRPLVQCSITNLGTEVGITKVNLNRVNNMKCA